MAQPKPPLVLRFLPSLTDFAFLSPLAILFFLTNGAHGLLADGDTGWHLRTGEWILRNHRIPAQDLYSYTMPGQPWFAWEWLWDVLFGWIHQNWGLAGVVLANAVVLCFISALLFRLVRRRCDNDFVAFAVTFLAMAVSAVHWLARPHLLSLLFLLISFCILERAAEGKTRALLWLPPLTAVWANVHGGFAGLFLLIGAYAAGELLKSLGARTFPASLRAARPYLFAFAGCLLASLLNPYGYQLHVHIFRYLSDPFYSQYVSEFGSIEFRDVGSLLFEAMIVGGAVAAFRSAAAGRVTDMLLFVGWLHMGLRSGRYIPLFAVIASPMIAAAVADLLKRLKDLPVRGWIRRRAAALEAGTASFAETDRVERFHVVSALAILVTAAVLNAPQPPPKWRPEFNPDVFPTRAVDAVRGPENARSIFAPDLWGGYLIYRLTPATQVFIDGRSDFYGPAFSKAYMNVLEVKDGWEEHLSRYHVDTILIQAEAPLAGALKQSARWRQVYGDKVALVFKKAVLSGPAGSPGDGGS
ncbi:MAG TPA: hypothetical protein VLH09_06355 [Bryobacteraceae bacterium]|nr:hypothetical protein [Bryobacteraceae bacterium]